MKKIFLSSEQKNLIRKYLKKFVAYTKSEAFLKDQKERIKHTDYFQNVLPKRLPHLSEIDIIEMITMLWASRIYGNKQYLASKIIEDNGIERIQESLKSLLDKSKPVGERYEQFIKKIKGLGPSSVTEMLCYIQPEDCGIWNQKARIALKRLKLDEFIDPNKYEITGEEYERFNELLKVIAKELKPKFKKQKVDLLFVDFFLYEVSQDGINDNEDTCGPNFDHNEIRDQVYEIGTLLGFDTDKEVRIGHGARVDVVWRARIGNLGVVTYVFEVHKSGSIDSLLLNLQKAIRNPTVQKVVAISDSQRLEQIKNEAEGLPEEFKRYLTFWDVKEVCEINEKLQSVAQFIEKLGLVAGI